MNDLPELPFEKVLSFLDLKDLITARAVSKEFKWRIDNFRVRSLCLSEWEPNYIMDKNRWIVGKFAHNFISSTRFESFFVNFGQSLLSRLNDLRVCNLDVADKTQRFALFVNSFESLESLGFVRVELRDDFKIILPKLKTIYVEWMEDDSITLTLDAPKLSKIEIFYIEARLNIVHPESVETLLIHHDYNLILESFKNLKFLFLTSFASTNESLLYALDQLKEIHFEMNYEGSLGLEGLFDQRRRYRRSEVKIYYRGLCLAGPDDYPEFLNDYLSSEALQCITANYSKLADQLLNDTIEYSGNVAGLRIPADFWRRLTNLRSIELNERVENVEQFLSFLSNCPSARGLNFQEAQSPDLLIELSTHRLSSQIQRLNFRGHDLNLDFSFLPKFEYLVRLVVVPFDVNLIPQVFKDLKFLRHLYSVCEGLATKIEIDRSKRIWLDIIGPEEDEVDDAVLAILEAEGAQEFRIFSDIDEVVPIITEIQRRINNIH